MKIHWIIPLTVDSAFQFTSKNELAGSIRKLGHSISTIVGYMKERTPIDGFTDVEYVYMPQATLLRKLVFHWRMLRSAWSSNADVVLFGFSAAHLLPLARLGWTRNQRPSLIPDIRTIPVDLTEGLKGKIEIFRFWIALKIANIFSNGITVITPALKKAIMGLVPRMRNFIGISTLGIDFKRFKWNLESTVRKEMGPRQ